MSCEMTTRHTSLATAVVVVQQLDGDVDRPVPLRLDEVALPVDS